MTTATDPQILRSHAFSSLRPGVRLIVLGAVHGNETCGTRAIERVLSELDEGALKIVKGTVTVEDMRVEGSAVRMGLNGTASIPERELDLKGSAALVTAARPGATPFELPFIVQGSWDDPIMLPDPEALIRRSGAAAPLLNAVKERSARDAVRSAIERLTGGAPSGGAMPAAEQAAPQKAD